MPSIHFLAVTFFTFRYFSTTDQNFFITGHIFLPCDWMFALIEKEKKKAQAFAPDEWLKIILDFRPSSPFQIQRIRRKDMKSFGILMELLPRPATFKVTQYCLISLSLVAVVHHSIQPNIVGRNQIPWEFRFFSKCCALSC